MMRSGSKNIHKPINWFMTLAMALTAMSFACNTSGKEDAVTPAVQTWTLTVKGRVGFPQQGGQITISEIKENGQPGGYQDTIKLKSNYTYVKKIKLTQPGYYKINFYNRQMVSLILNKADVEVNVDGNNPQGFFEIKGSPDLDLIKKVQELQAASQTAPELEKINQEYQVVARSKNEERMGELVAQYMAIVKGYTDQIADLMVKESPSLAVINLMTNGTPDKDQYHSAYVAVAEKLKKEWPDYEYAKNFVAYVDKLKVTAIGQPAPEIALPDPNGKVVALSSLRGKYVLVDFWAKWCGPCRTENPNVVKAYNKYKDKGFTVFGVSLDRTKEDWLRAIQEDGLTWTHVSDLKYWQSEAAKTYSITGIPFSVLVDPNGVIIGKNLRGVALHQKLEEVLNKK